MKLLILSLVLIFVGCKEQPKKIDPKSEECKCKDGSYFPETGECKVVLYIQEPCLFLPEDRVCGCDGMNYANICYQHQAGVKLSTKGFCPTNP